MKEKVEYHKDCSITIDGKPLTKLTNDPIIKGQYAKETRILIEDWKESEMLVAWIYGQTRL